MPRGEIIIRAPDSALVIPLRPFTRNAAVTLSSPFNGEPVNGHRTPQRRKWSARATCVLTNAIPGSDLILAATWSSATVSPARTQIARSGSPASA
jgi:hypothetical protein